MAALQTIDDEYTPEDVFIYTKKGATQSPQHVTIINVDRENNEFVVQTFDRKITRYASPDELVRIDNPAALTMLRKPKEEEAADEIDHIPEEEEETSVITSTTHMKVERIVYGQYLLKTWYYSPYPIPAREGKDLEPDDPGRVIVKTEDGLNRIEEPFILWICHQCFKYMSHEAFEDHIKICPHTKPPGRKVYQNGGVSMYEVDGFQNKVYCQCLCLLCKCFIDIKTLYFDCESFLFYVMTLVDEESGEEQVIGYFSKERFSFNSHNLACIIVLPPWQKRGFGMLMIEFSYYLSRKQGMIGGPEGPLSDLGLIGYYSYWVSSIIRFLRQQISVPLPKDNLETSHPFNYLKKPRHPVVPYRADPDDASSSSANEADDDEESDHELPAPVIKRRYYHSMLPNGEVRVGVTARFTMKDIVQATGIRPREVAFVLHQLGLSRMEAQMQADADDVFIILSREAIESVAAACRMKEPRFSEKHLIP